MWSAYHAVLHHFHGLFGAVDSRQHGEVAVALSGVSLWTAESPWQVLLLDVDVYISFLLFLFHHIRLSHKLISDGHEVARLLGFCEEMVFFSILVHYIFIF